jgi:TATA-box binding protein (TBP) (component of TFIID and TFIIIB)
MNWNNYEFKEYINVKDLSIKGLPDNLTITTMCATAKIGTIININNIYNLIELSNTDIITVKRDADTFRTLSSELLLKKKNKTKKITHFFNQISVIVKIDNDDKNVNDCRKINVKLFKNGSLQLSGCKLVSDINIVFNKLIHRLTTGDIEFVENKNAIRIYDFKIDMINSNYKIVFNINRKKLYEILLNNNITCTYEPCIRACVSVKYLVNDTDNKPISIFIFEKGNIIITGSKNAHHIISSFNYINTLLTKYQNQIKIISLDEQIAALGYKHLLNA